MSGSHVLFMAALLFSISQGALLSATPDKVDPREQIKLDCAGLHSADWQQRQKSFNALVDLGMGGKATITAPRDGTRMLVDRYPELRDLISTSLIALLQTEDNLVAANTQLTPDHRNFYSDVVMAVSVLHDPRSAQALLGAVDTGNMAVAAAAGLGNATLTPALAMLKAATNRDDKLDMMVVLMQMAQPRNFDKLQGVDAKKQLKQALIQAATDKEPLIRRSGIEGLMALGDRDTIPLLQQIADTDPETTGKPGALQYPIREYAKQAVETIEKNGKS
ncbi:MAG: HEAT repeat domain-containing protein [Bryobacteraceae bacterium]